MALGAIGLIDSDLVSDVAIAGLLYNHHRVGWDYVDQGGCGDPEFTLLLVVDCIQGISSPC